MSAGVGNSATRLSKQRYPSSSLFNKLDRGTTSGLLSTKQDTVTPYFNYHKNNSSGTLRYTEDGQLVTHSVNDEYNKQLIANMNPKTI